MLLIYLDENALSESEREQCWEDSAQFAHELNGGGQSLAAAPLDPSSTATSVRVCDGKRQVTDGPCAETREQLGRYFLIDARDLDEAIGIQQGVGEPLKSGRSWRSRACRWIDWFDFNRSEQFRAPPQTKPVRRRAMRFMMIVNASKDSEAGKMPSEELLAAMGAYNDELMKAGVLLDLSGLHASSKGARIKFSGGKRAVIDGPFAETKELVAGFWVIKAKSKEEAIEWAKRVPAPHGEGEEAEIEIRQLFELEDFGPSEAVDRARELGKDLAKKKK